VGSSTVAMTPRNGSARGWRLPAHTIRRLGPG
jgi:hypothetical protein